MKNQIGIIILIIVCLGLGITLITSKKKAAEQQKTDANAIYSLSNSWVETRGSLEDQRKVNATLEQDLAATRKQFSEAYTDLSNRFVQVSGSLAATEATLKATQEEMARKVAERDSKITELQSQNQALDKQALDLSAAITNLTTQIAETEKKLAASEGDKAFLQGELKRLMSEKAELERQFNDLAILRAQVAKLKEELSIARRIEWIRRGLFPDPDQRGATRLMQGFPPPPKPKPNYDLNVEILSDGSVRVIPPRTNAPAATNAPVP